MSINSFHTIDCTYPRGTETHGTAYEPEGHGDRLTVFEEDAGSYSDEFLDGLTEFFGRPLDEVPGLELDAHYEYHEDDDWQFNVTIKGGKVSCERTVTTWRPCDLADLGLSMAMPNERKAREAWERLGSVAVDGDGCLESRAYIPHLGHYDAGTDREEVWHDMEDVLGVSVAWLMGQCKNSDGTN